MNTNNTISNMPMNNQMNMGQEMMNNNMQNIQNYNMNQYIQPNYNSDQQQIAQLNSFMPIPHQSNLPNNVIQPIDQINSTMEHEESKEPAKMRLPSYVKQKHFRSISMGNIGNENQTSLTPIDTQTNKYISNNFLFDKASPLGHPGINKISKMSSVGVAPSYAKNALKMGSSNSLPAIRNSSDFYDSVASESSIFDGNDSALASSVDIELDTNGQPIFDNLSNAGDSANGKMEYSDNSDDAPLVSRVRNAVKKKSGFAARERKLSVSSDESKDSN
jgi:hypothetical protein